MHEHRIEIKTAALNPSSDICSGYQDVFLPLEGFRFISWHDVFYLSLPGDERNPVVERVNAVEWQRRQRMRLHVGTRPKAPLNHELITRSTEKKRNKTNNGWPGMWLVMKELSIGYQVNATPVKNLVRVAHSVNLVTWRKRTKNTGSLVFFFVLFSRGFPCIILVLHVYRTGTGILQSGEPW